MYQQVTVIGNLGRDPEMRHTQAGVEVCSFSVATSRSWTNKDGQKQEKTVWWRITAWRKLAEICNQYLQKGNRVFITGEMEEPGAWADAEGNPRASLELTAQTVKFLSGPNEPSLNGAKTLDDVEEEIPF